MTATATAPHAPPSISDETALQRGIEMLNQGGWDGLESAIVVLGSTQRLILLEAGKAATQWVISTAKNGFGCRENSGCTPTGLHAIAEKIGSDAPVGMRFVGREATGEVIHQTDDHEQDYITSRILWLTGREPGHNRGDDGEAGIDTHARYIYIHGTPHLNELGRPLSAGCIRLHGGESPALFERVQSGTLVAIVPSAPVISNESAPSHEPASG